MATEDLVIKVSADGLVQVTRETGKLDKQLKKTGKSGSRAGRQISAGFRGATRGLSRLTALAGGLGLALGGKAILSFNAQLGQLQADTGKSTAEMTKWRSSLLAAASATGTGKDGLLAFVQEMQDFGGRSDEAIANIDDIAKLMKATGAEGKSVGQVMGTLGLQFGVTGSQAVDAIGKMVTSANAGTVKFKNFAGVVAELAGTVKDEFRDPAKAIEQLNIAAQIVGAQFGGNAERARTAVDALFRDIGANAKKFKAQKLDVFDAEGNIKGIEEVSRLILQRFGGRAAKAQNAGLLTAESVKAVKAFSSSFDTTTGNYKQDSALTAVRKANAAGGRANIEAQFQRRVTGIDEAGESLGRTLKKIDEQFQELGGGVLDVILKNQALALGGAAVGFGGFKLFKFLRGRKKGGGGGLDGDALDPGVQRVFVVNMGAGGMGGATPTGPGGKLGKLAKGAKFTLGAASAGAFGFAFGTAIDRALGLSDKISNLAFAGSDHRMAQGRSRTAEITASRQALALKKLRDQGVSSFETAGGGRKELTDKNIIEAVTKNKQFQDIEGKKSQLMIAALEKILRGEIKGETAITKSRDDLNREDRQIARGFVVAKALR